MRSLLLRIALAFIIFNIVTVGVLTFVINNEIADHFGRYLHMHQGMGMHGPGRGPMIMGRLETEFLQSLRSSLLLAAVLMVAAGGGVSYYLARSIARPVIRLNKAVNDLAAGDLDAKAEVDRRDEVGQLARAFNEMTTKLKSDTILRQRFLAGIAHELRTPLTILKANLEGIADGIVKPDKEQIDSLTEEVDRLAKMVGDLKELSLLEAGQVVLEFSNIDMNLVVNNVCTKLKTLTSDKNIDLDYAFSQGSLFIRADQARVSQMLYNLLMNAIKYTGEGGKIKVTTNLQDGLAEISVIDTGSGISAEHLPHIFDYFYRTDQSRTKESGGTGLGLAVVRQLALAHGGQVNVESKTGQGSIFTLVLPQEKQHYSSTGTP